MTLFMLRRFYFLTAVLLLRFIGAAYACSAMPSLKTGPGKLRNPRPAECCPTVQSRGQCIIVPPASFPHLLPIGCGEFQRI